MSVFETGKMPWKWLALFALLASAIGLTSVYYALTAATMVCASPDDQRRWIGLLAGGSILALGALIGFLWRHQRAAFYREKYCAERARQASEQRCHALLEKAPMIAYVLDPTGHIVALNPAFEQVTGWKRADWLGRLFAELFPPEDQPEMTQVFQRALRGELPNYAERRVISANGAILTLEILGMPQEEDGRVIGVMGFARDVTVSKHAEDVLRASEERFRALVEHSSDLILILNRDTTIRYASPSVRTILGYGMDQIHGRSVLEFIHPNDHAAAQEAFVHRLARPGASDELMTVRARHRDGALHTIELIGSNLLENPAVAGIVINCHDITERQRADAALRESEEKYRQLVKYAPTGIYQINFTERKFVDVNDVMCQYTGYTREEFLALDPLDLLAEASRDLFLGRWLKIVAGEPVPETVEFKIKGKNGQEFWVLLNVRYVIEPEQPVIATVIAHNITERKHTEEALRESEERYRDLVEHSHAFICTHDLQGRFLSANHWAMQLLGYENFPTEPLNLRDILAPQARGAADDYLARVQRDGFAEGLMLVQTRSGEKRLWEYHNTLRTEGVAEPIVRGIAHDITEQNKLERALRESEERWRTYIDQANDLIFALDASGRCTLANRALCSTLGYAAEEFIGKSPLEFIAPDARDFVMSALARVFSGEEVDRFEADVLTRDQRHITLEIRGRTFRKDGAIVGTLHIARDVSERNLADEWLRQQKQQYQSLLENVSDIIILMDEHRFIRYVSPSAERVLGYQPNDVIGADAFALVHPDDLPATEEVFRRALQNPWMAHRVEHRLQRVDGAWRDMETIAQAHQREFGVDIAVSSRDITERRHAAEMLTAERNLLRTMVDAIPDVIFIKDREGRFVLNNLFHLRTLDMATQAETLGKTVADFHPLDLADEYLADDSQILETGQPLIEKEQIYLDRASGQRRWHLMTKVPLRDARGQITAVVGIGRDITERKRAEDELRRSRKEWQDIFNAIGHPTFILDPQHGVVAANSALLKQLGKTEDQVLGKRCFELYHDSDRPPHNCPMRALFVSGKMESTTMEMQTVAGTYWVSCTPVLDARGNLEKVIHIATDITPLKRTQTELQEANARFIALVEGIPDIVYLKDLQGRNLYVNKAYEEFAGTSRGNIIGKCDDEIMPPDLAARCRASDQQAFEQRGTIRSEECTADRAGNLVCYETIKNPIFDAAGNVSGLVGISRDVSERKRAEQNLRESEAQFRALIESAPVAISLGREGKLIYANPAYVQMYGFASADELIGSAVADRVAPQSRDESFERSRLRAQGQPVETQYDLVGLRRDGTEFPMIATVTRVNLTDGPANIGFFQDITERKRAEAQLKKYSEQLEQMVEARTRELRDAQEQLVRQERLATLGQLAGSIAHELRSPLGAIKNAAYYFKMCVENPSPDAREMMQILDQQVDTSARIIGSLLEFARPKTPTLQRAHLPAVIDAAARQCETPENVALVWNVAEDLPMVMIDAGQMQIVFRNLIANAIQAMSEGGTLTLGARRLPENSDQFSVFSEQSPVSGELRTPNTERWILITVSDTGHGIPPEAVDKIFQPLYTTKAKGIGLGLAMCKMIVEAHNGKIQVTSQVGQGTTFTIALPMSPAV